MCWFFLGKRLLYTAGKEQKFRNVKAFCTTICLQYRVEKKLKKAVELFFSHSSFG